MRSVLLTMMTAAIAISAHAADPCAKVVRACRAGGFVNGPNNKHRGQGLWGSCVRGLAKGKTVKGVKGVSKRDAQLCLKARYPKG